MDCSTVGQELTYLVHGKWYVCTIWWWVFNSECEGSRHSISSTYVHTTISLVCCHNLQDTCGEEGRREGGKEGEREGPERDQKWEKEEVTMQLQHRHTHTPLLACAPSGRGMPPSLLQVYVISVVSFDSWVQVRRTVVPDSTVIFWSGPSTSTLSGERGGKEVHTSVMCPLSLPLKTLTKCTECGRSTEIRWSIEVHRQYPDIIACQRLQIWQSLCCYSCSKAEHHHIVIFPIFNTSLYFKSVHSWKTT